jgi:hypothetical protein
MIFLVYLVATVIAIVIHLGVAKKPLTKGKVVEVILLYLLVFFVGMAGLVGAMAHILRGPETAAGIGWQAGSPFQFEVGVANLAFGVLGILCIWKRSEFWTATGIGYSVFLLGCTYGHIYEMMVHHDYAPYNAGVGIFFNDAVIPVMILILLGLRASFAEESRSS